MLTNIVAVIGKLCLSNAQTSRMLRAILLEVIRVPANSVYVLAMKTATKQYADKATELRQNGKNSDQVEEAMAQPHIHAWNAVVNTAMERFKNRQEHAKQDVLQKYCQEYQAKGMLAIGKEVEFCYIKNPHCPDMKHIEIRVAERKHNQVISADHVWELIKPDILSQEGAKELPGIAPRGNLERQIQDWLTSMGMDSSNNQGL